MARAKLKQPSIQVRTSLPPGHPLYDVLRPRDNPSAWLIHYATLGLALSLGQLPILSGAVSVVQPRFPTPDAGGNEGVHGRAGGADPAAQPPAASTRPLPLEGFDVMGLIESAIPKPRI